MVARNYFEKLTSIDPGNFQNKRLLGWCYFWTGEIRLAKINYLSALKGDCTNKYALLNLGHIELCLAHTNRALIYYRRGLLAWQDQIEDYFKWFELDYELIKRYHIPYSYYQDVKTTLLEEFYSNQK